jgi:hypothetical protein
MITMRADLRPVDSVSGTVVFDAVGDDMAFTVPVAVTVGDSVRRAGPRVRP